MTGFWYLATPYSRYPRGKGEAYRCAVRAAAFGFEIWDALAGDSRLVRGEPCGSHLRSV